MTELPSEMCPECEGYEGCDPAPGVEPDDEGFCGLCHGTGYLSPIPDQKTP